MSPIIRRRIIPVSVAPTPSAPAAPKPGPRLRAPASSDRAELRKKLAEVIQPPSEPTEGTAAYIILKYRRRVRNPMTAIRAKCVECSNGYLREVEHCKVTQCALHAFRMGKNPFHSRSRAFLEANGGGEPDGVDGESGVDDTDDSTEPIEARDE